MADLSSAVNPTGLRVWAQRNRRAKRHRNLFVRFTRWRNDHVELKCQGCLSQSRNTPFPCKRPRRHSRQTRRAMLVNQGAHFHGWFSEPRLRQAHRSTSCEGSAAASESPVASQHTARIRRARRSYNSANAALSPLSTPNTSVASVAATNSRSADFGGHHNIGDRWLSDVHCKNLSASTLLETPPVQFALRYPCELEQTCSPMSRVATRISFAEDPR